MSKPRKSKWMPFDAAEYAEPYEILHRLRKAHHVDLNGTVIRLAWMVNRKADKFGVLKFGVCIKVPELYAKITGINIIIALNRDWWELADEKARDFLMDHELCHARPSVDKHFEQVEDDTGRKIYRLARHDLEEFAGPVKRHGMQLADTRRFVEVANMAQRTLPYESSDSGEALEGTPVN